MARGLTKKSDLVFLAFGLLVQAHTDCGPITRAKAASHKRFGDKCQGRDLDVF